MSTNNKYASIRPLTIRDSSKAAKTLYKAFKTDVLSRYVSKHLEDQPEYRQKVDIALYEAYVYSHILRGLVFGIEYDPSSATEEVDDGTGISNAECFETVSLWAPPGVNIDDPITFARSYYKFAWLTGAAGRKRVFTTFFGALVFNFHDALGKEDNDAYALVYLASTPAARGKGNARKMLEYMFETHIDKENKLTYLESSSAVNIPIYEKFGFRWVRDMIIGDENDPNGDFARLNVMVRGNKALHDEKIYSWIIELVYGPNKETALLELGKKREEYDDLALVLWYSFGVMTSLLEEIVAVYPLLSPSNLNPNNSNRVCNALALLQCVASHLETRNLFLQAHLPLFLYPFLNTNSKQRPFEYLRLTSLGVIGALVKNDTPEVIQFLLTTEIIPLCLNIMESSSELSKTVAIFIVQKILVDDAGLSYICQTYERFNAVTGVLKTMVEQLVNQQTGRLLKHVVRCYLRLSDNVEARNILRQQLPEPLKDGTFGMILRDDGATKRCLAQLLVNLSE
ncbi:hypothetical protein BABINDRAFT_172492 [Babjeviella inositovora NRRL Y-12698]|uniref:N-acetyltransferase domain-containing protein n=1 Tax=Babjeviella inositovora NRRL Y-12698 TaxID=984486 RepID=A0A1E3QLS7_9ASCO|nr:uncharacterized protein BABINDRAFT_172492 [Babjeviella inositovora NRRL Y-12698]ODQ78032.1 hypothetical protein BABINDRAFT_172492 [Babjeviella inositovora NRRL Y-12698]